MEDNLQQVRKCLTLISRIAARGACSPLPEHVRDTLFELIYALDARRGWPEPTAHEMTSNERRVQRLHDELDEIDATSQPLQASLILEYSVRSTWN
jgi:hypothetical protein